MKIVIEIPDWHEGRHLRLFAGVEEIARKLDGRGWEIKVDRCQLCGACCLDCQYLEVRPGYEGPDGSWAKMCSLNTARPQECAHSDGPEGDCFITWKLIDGS